MTAANAARVSVRVFSVCVGCLVYAGGIVAQDPGPTLPQVLAAAGSYIAEYERTFAVIVAEERYEQSANSLAASTSVRHRVTTSDFLLFNTGGGGWMVFRDVVTLDEVNAVAEPGRLLKLVANPTREALAEAMRTTAASQRYNIGIAGRAVTVPTGALTYLRRENQSQSAFALDGLKTIDKETVAVIKFKASSDQTAANEAITTGRFWIEPKSGRVTRTELVQTSPASDAKIEVQYASQPGIPVWLPVRMFEQYDVVNNPRNIGRVSSATVAHLDGLATYRNFRQFEAKPGLIIK